MGSAALLALAILASAPAAAQAGGPASNAPAPRMRWSDAAAFSLKATVPVPTMPLTVAGRRGSGAKGVARSNWSPRIRGGAGPGASAWGPGGPRFNLEAVPVTIGGQRFILSRFTMSRAGVRGMISTAF